MARKALKKYDVNPLVQPRELVMKERTVKVGSARELVDTTSGEICNVNAIYQRKIVDSEKFAKVYLDGVAKTFELGSAARKVFTVVLRVCQKDTDRIYLNWMIVEEAEPSGLSERTFQRGIAELIAKGFIAASTMPSMFWINVHLFFNGDRVKFITEYVRENTSKQPTRDPRTVDFIEGHPDQEAS